MTTPTPGLEAILQTVEEVYRGLFDSGDTEAARAAFDELLGKLRARVRSDEAPSDELLEALHVIADVGAELGRADDVRFAAGELARSFVPEDDEDLMILVDDMLMEWRCPEAAQRLLERLQGQVAPELLNSVQVSLSEERQAVAEFPLSTAQVMALRRQLLLEQVVVEEPDGFLIEEDDEEPFKRTMAWLSAQGLDAASVVTYLEEETDCGSDPEVLLALQPVELYDMLAHWEVEGLARRYWMEAAVDAAAQNEGGAEASPDGRWMAIFDDDERVAFLYVYDTEDEELAVPPVWLYNRQSAPAEGAPQPAAPGQAPLMPANYLKDPAPWTAELSELELLWSADSRWVVVKVNGNLVGVADTTEGRGFSCRLAQPSDLGEPLPADLPFP